MEAGLPGVVGQSAVLLVAREDSACAPEPVTTHHLSMVESIVPVLPWNLLNAQDPHALSLEVGATGMAGLHAALLVASEDAFTERDCVIIPKPRMVALNVRDLMLTQSSASSNTARSTENGAAGQNTCSTASPVEREVSSLVSESAPTQSQCMEVQNVTVMIQTRSQLSYRLAL